jgi:hypothetical protein
VGATHGGKLTECHSPERAEYQTGILISIFNPSGVAREFYYLYRGLHPRLFKLNPFGVNTFIQIKKSKNAFNKFIISVFK